MQMPFKTSMNTSTRASGWMKPMALLMLTSSGGCMSVASTSAICDESFDLRTHHAAALSQDGGLLSQRTGAALIAKLDAGCDDA